VFRETDSTNETVELFLYLSTMLWSCGWGVEIEPHVFLISSTKWKSAV